MKPPFPPIHLFLPVFIFGLLLVAVPEKTFAQKKGKQKSEKAEETPPQIGFPIPPANTAQEAFMEGSALLMRGAYLEAIPFFQKAVAEKPGFHAAQYGLARTFIILNRFNEAIAPGKAALAADPANFWYYETLADAHQGLGEYKQAAAVLQEAVNRFPELHQVRVRLAEVYLLNRQPDKTIATLTHKNTASFNERFESKKLRLLLEARGLQEAKASVSRLIGMDPFYPEYYQLQYQVFTDLRKPDSAALALRSLLSIDPGNGFALLTLADVYKSTGNLALSDSFLFIAFKNPEIEPAGKIGLIQNLAAYQANDPALQARIRELTRLLVEAHPLSPETVMLQASRLITEGRPDSARTFFRLALDKEPAAPETWRNLLLISAEMADYPTLYKDASLALEYYPNDGTFLFFHGLACTYTGELEEGQNSLNKVQRLAEGKPGQLAEIGAAIARLEAMQGNRAAAEARFAQSLELQPQNAFAHYLFAEYLSDQPGKSAQALSHARDACSFRDGYPPFMYLYGALLVKEKKFDEAEPYLAKAASATWNATYFEKWGDALLKLGKTAQARAAWEKARKAGARFDVEEKINQ